MDETEEHKSRVLVCLAALCGAFAILAIFVWTLADANRTRTRVAQEMKEAAARDLWLDSARKAGFEVYQGDLGIVVSLHSQHEIAVMSNGPPVPLPGVRIRTTCYMKLADKGAIERRFPSANVYCDDGQAN